MDTLKKENGLFFFFKPTVGWSGRGAVIDKQRFQRLQNATKILTFLLIRIEKTLMNTSIRGTLEFMLESEDYFVGVRK